VLKVKVCIREGCDEEFTFQRSDKIYCSPNCRKRATERTQNRTESADKRRRDEEYWDRVNLAFENLLKQPPTSRAEWLQDYIDHPTTSKITGNPALLKATSFDSRGLNRKVNNIAKIANRFTQQVYGVSIKIYLKDIRDSEDKEARLYDWSVFEGPLPILIITGYDQD